MIEEGEVPYHTWMQLDALKNLNLACRIQPESDGSHNVDFQ